MHIQHTHHTYTYKQTKHTFLSGRDNMYSSCFVSRSGSHMCWAPQRILLIYDFVIYLSSCRRPFHWYMTSSDIFRLAVGRFSSFHFIISRKVAMGLTVNNFWSVHQIPIMLYIFGILGALSVQLYKNIKILT